MILSSKQIFDVGMTCVFKSTVFNDVRVVDGRFFAAIVRKEEVATGFHRQELAFGRD